MKHDKVEITDEMLACYLDGKLTGEEKRAVEVYLSDNKEAMDTLMMARYELGFRQVKRRFYALGVVGLVALACLVLLVWRLLTPIQMKVNITDDKAYSVAALPFDGGTLQCEYAGKCLVSTGCRRW